MLDTSFLSEPKKVKIGRKVFRIKALSVIEWCLMYGMANLLSELETGSKEQKKVIQDICRLGCIDRIPFFCDTLSLAVEIIKFNDYSKFVQYIKAESSASSYVDTYWVRHIVHEVCEAYKMDFNALVASPMGRVMGMLSEIRRAKLISELASVTSSIDLIENGNKTSAERERSEAERLRYCRERLREIEAMLKDGIIKDIPENKEESDSLRKDLEAWLKGE